jgi:isoquinoline 1-oxidoreductase beta subunit
VEAVYEAPFLSHSPMEPLNCTVQIAPDRVDVWISTQSPMAVLQTAAKETGVAPENVYVHNAFVGGGFGRRGGAPDELVHAIAVAKQFGKPVKLIWSREQDLRRDRYRPQAAVRFKAALDETGKPQAFQARVAVPSLIRPGPADRPGQRADGGRVHRQLLLRLPVPRRGCGAEEQPRAGVVLARRRQLAERLLRRGFVDEMAHAAGQDPLAFRRALLAHRPTRSACSTRWRRRATGASRCPRAAAVGWRSSRPMAASPARSSR